MNTATAARVFAGHPVDIATGEQFTAAHDIEMRGVVPLIFRRVYKTSFLERPASVLGPGWVHVFDASLSRDLDGYLFEGHDGDRVGFNDADGSFEAGTSRTSVLNQSASMELRREGEHLVVYHWHGPNAPVQKYVFRARDGEPMRLVARVLPSGQGLRIGRDHLGRTVTVTQTTERRRLYLSYDDDGRLSALHLGFAAQPAEDARLIAQYEYDAESRLVGVYDANGEARRYEYDDLHRLVAETGRGGGTYRMRYDTQGRCIETGGEDGYRRYTFRYEPGRVTRVTDSLGFETVYQYNAQGQVELKILPNGGRHITELDDYGRIVGEVDPLGKTTRYRYDSVGRVDEKTFPNGSKVQFEYDEYHQPIRITEPDGAVRTLQYDRGAVVGVEDSLGTRITYRRGPSNELTGSLSSSGQELSISANDQFTEQVVADQLGVLTRRTLDVFLNPTQISDAGGLRSIAQYDRVGRLIRVDRPDGTHRQLEYDADGHLTRMTDARGGVWSARYTAYGDCVEQVDPIGRQHRFTWDTEGRLTSITNPKGETARFEYDSVGSVTAVQHFDGSREEASYDLASRLTGRLRRDGTRLQFDRDDVGNLLELSAGDADNGRVVLRSFAYDSCGRAIEARSPDAHVVFEYAVGGRRTAEIQNGRRIDYRFDSNGFLSGRLLEGSRVGLLTFQYDTRGRIRRFSNASQQGQSYEYDLRNQCTGRTLGFSATSSPASSDLAVLRETREYDQVGRLRRQSVGAVANRTYEYDAEGLLTEALDDFRGRVRYEYDAVDQLSSSVSDALGRHGYDYDANGNLTAKDSEPLEYDAGNGLRRMGRVAIERDRNGQLARLSGSSRDDRYDWDQLGQLKRVVHRDGSETIFKYDALGRRVAKEHRGPGMQPGEARTIQYFWTGDDLLAEQSDGVLTEYAMWGFVAEALWEDGKIRHIVPSPQGVPQELIDESGRVVWRGTFDDWGRLVEESGETSCRLRLPGQIFDEETGLHYNRFRYYSPDAGQFISPDPMGYGRSKNLFRFAPNAIGWIDTLGLECWAHVGQEQGATRRQQTPGDADFGSKEAALAEACNRHGILPDTIEVKQMYGDNPNLVGPKGQPWEQISGLNAKGEIVTFDHHASGHFFQDTNEFENPHYHGPNGEHLSYL